MVLRVQIGFYGQNRLFGNSKQPFSTPKWSFDPPMVPSGYQQSLKIDFRGRCLECMYGVFWVFYGCFELVLVVQIGFYGQNRLFGNSKQPFSTPKWSFDYGTQSGYQQSLKIDFRGRCLERMYRVFWVFYRCFELVLRFEIGFYGQNRLFGNSKQPFSTPKWSFDPYCTQSGYQQSLKID